MFAFTFIYDTDDYDDDGQFNVIAENQTAAVAALKDFAAAKGMKVSVLAITRKAVRA